MTEYLCTLGATPANIPPGRREGEGLLIVGAMDPETAILRLHAISQLTNPPGNADRTGTAARSALPSMVTRTASRCWSSTDAREAASNRGTMVMPARQSACASSASTGPGSASRPVRKAIPSATGPRHVVEFANALGLKRFAVAGVSSGSPYALACARFSPEWLIGCAVGFCI
jgi:hypothetical protein